MRIRILTISERQPDWVTQCCNEYLRRLPRHLAAEVVELALAKRREDPLRAKADEGERLLAAVPKGALVVALDEHGSAWTSVQLAQQLERWQHSGRDLALLIGGPDGLSPAALASAQQRWSLSPLTLPHGMARMVVAEQLYRAQSIIEGHPYHRP